MSNEVGGVHLTISAVFKGFDEAMDKAQKATENLGKNFDKMQGKMSSAGKSLSLYLTAPLHIAGAAMIKFASDYDESINKVDVAFGKSSEAVKEWSKTTLDKIGLASGSALDAAATYGDMATAMGLTQDKAANMSISLVNLAGDLASFKNISIDVANTALKGIFTGEGEALKGLGVIMLDSTLKEYAMAQGIKKKYEEMTQAEKVNLRYNYVMSQTVNSQGDFERTGGGAANQMRKFTEGLKQLAQTFGAIILPAFTAVITKINEFITWIGNLSESNKTIILSLLGVAAAIGPLLIASSKIVGVYKAFSAASAVLKTVTLAQSLATGTSTIVLLANAAATKIVTAATWLWNTALAANPIGLIILSVVALTVAIGGLIQFFGTEQKRIDDLNQKYKELIFGKEAYRNKLIETGKTELTEGEKTKQAIDSLIAKREKEGKTSAEIREEIVQDAIAMSDAKTKEAVKAERSVVDVASKIISIAGVTRLALEKIGFIETDASRIAKSGADISAAYGNALKVLEAQQTKAADKQRTTAAANQRAWYSDYIKVNEAYQKMVEDSGKNELQLLENNHRRELELLAEKTQQGKISVDNYISYRSAMDVEYTNKRIELENKIFCESAQSVLTGAGQINAGLTDVTSMYYANQQAEIDNTKQRGLEAIQAQYDAEKAAIDNSVLSATDKAAALKALDEKRAREEKALTEKAEKEKRKIARESAIAAKAMAISDTIINTSVAVMRAYADTGPIGGPIFAGILAALGAAKIALIAAQPLPVAAQGIFANSPYIGGEAGPELAFPLSSPNGKDALKLFSQQLVNEMGTVESNKSAVSSGNVYLDGSLVGKWIESNVADRRIILV